jgi:hypothetical protein
MFPCCRLCYKKYLKDNGEVDLDLYMKIVLDRRREGKETPDPEDLCRCECHKINSCVMH